MIVTTMARWNHDSDGYWVSFLCDPGAAKEAADKVSQGKEYTVTVKRKTKTRSLNANRYFHLLVNKIAAATGVSDEEAKTILVTSYGTLERNEDGTIVAFRLPDGLSASKICKYAIPYGYAMIDGRRWVNYKVYKPSHTLTVEEMSRLIDGTIYEAHNLGIETASEAELDLMKGAWIPGEA